MKSENQANILFEAYHYHLSQYATLFENESDESDEDDVRDKKKKKSANPGLTELDPTYLENADGLLVTIQSDGEKGTECTFVGIDKSGRYHFEDQDGEPMTLTQDQVKSMKIEV